jgi:hypothetical protein
VMHGILFEFFAPANWVIVWIKRYIMSNLLWPGVSYLINLISLFINKWSLQWLLPLQSNFED